MRTTFAIVALLGASACSLLTPRVSRPPLEHEGDVFVYLQPWPQEAARASFTVSALAAVRSDGLAIPLELRLSELPGVGAGAQRLLASGRLPPGGYAALQVTVARASVASPEGPARLLVASEPTIIPAAFEVRAQRATVLSLALRYEASLRPGYAFAPQFAVSVPARPMPQLDAFASNGGTNDLTVFDKRRREAFAVVPTGREPQGIVLGPGLNRMYVALAGDDDVAVFDVTTREPLPPVRLTPGDHPAELALSPDGRTLVILNRGSQSLAFVDAPSGNELSRVQTGSAPASLLVDRSFRRAYVLNEGSSTMTVVDLGVRAVVATVGTEAGPIRAQVNRAGNRLYVIHSGSPQMVVFSLPDLAVVGRVTVGLGAAALKVDARSDLIYLAKRDDPRLYVYDAFSLIPIDFFDVPAGVTWIAIDDTENTLLALMPARREVAVLDIPSRRLLGTVGVGEEPYAVTVAGERF